MSLVNRELNFVLGTTITRSNGFMELAACLFEVDFSCLVPWKCDEGAMGVP